MKNMDTVGKNALVIGGSISNILAKAKIKLEKKGINPNAIVIIDDYIDIVKHEIREKQNLRDVVQNTPIILNPEEREENLLTIIKNFIAEVSPLIPQYGDSSVKLKEIIDELKKILWI